MSHPAGPPPSRPDGRGPTLPTLDLDVALLPREAAGWSPRVCIVVDELRASSTLTTLVDLGCPAIFVTPSLAEARRLGRQHGAILAGERHGLTPRGFDHNNSPAELARAGIGGRPVVLSTSNGTRALRLVRHMPATLVGCLNNASACARAAVGLALRAPGTGIGIVCAGVEGRFALDDAAAAGEIAGAIVRVATAAGVAIEPTDGARAALSLRDAHPDVLAALEASTTGRLVHRIDAAEDIAWCARIDATAAVPILRPGPPMRVEPLLDPEAEPLLDPDAEPLG